MANEDTPHHDASKHHHSRYGAASAGLDVPREVQVLVIRDWLWCHLRSEAASAGLQLQQLHEVCLLETRRPEHSLVALVEPEGDQRAAVNGFRHAGEPGLTGYHQPVTAVEDLHTLLPPAQTVYDQS